MQISRLFEIVYILLGRRHVTARELAERFEVSVRTIYRDIEALSQAGVPVYATQGAGGGIFISDAYVLNKSALTDQEQNQILLALQSVSATGNVDSDKLLSRMASLFNKDGAEWIEVDFSRWGNEDDDRRKMATLKDGILGRRMVTFIYHSTSGEKMRRHVSPVKLVYKSRAWYLQGYCNDREAFRTFKLSRMTEVQLLEDTFDRQALPELPPREPIWGEPMPPIDVTLRFAPQLAWRVLDEYDPALVEWLPDGTAVVQAKMFDDEGMFSFLLSYGTLLEVLAPESLRARVLEHLQKISAMYGRT